MITQKQANSKINGIMELLCAEKRRSENMKRNTEFQRHLELLMVLPRQKIFEVTIVFFDRGCRKYKKYGKVL